MPPYFDIYVLSQHRSATAAAAFLEEFAPNREQSALDYPFPEFAEQPSVVFGTAPEAIDFCDSQPNETQSIYFRNLGAGAAHVMVFFTSDGALILGLSVVDQAEKWLGRLEEFAGSKVSLMAFETAPPLTIAEFVALAGGISEPPS